MLTADIFGVQPNELCLVRVRRATDGRLRALDCVCAEHSNACGHKEDTLEGSTVVSCCLKKYEEKTLSVGSVVHSRAAESLNP